MLNVVELTDLLTSNGLRKSFNPLKPCTKQHWDLHGREESECLVQNRSQILHVPDVVVCGVARWADDGEDFFSKAFENVRVLGEEIRGECKQGCGLSIVSFIRDVLKEEETYCVSSCNSDVYDLFLDQFLICRNVRAKLPAK